MTIHAEAHRDDIQLGLFSGIGGMVALVLAVIPAPMPLITLTVGGLVCAVSLIAVVQGPTAAGLTSAAGLAGLATSVVAMMITGVFIVTAPETPEVVSPGPTVTDLPWTAEPPRTAEPPTVVTISPLTTTATSTAASGKDAGGEVVTFAAENMIDGDATTAWRAPGAAVGEEITFSFPQRVHITSVAMIPGYAKIDSLSGINRFEENRRVTQAQFDFDAASYEWTYADLAEPQANDVDAEVLVVQMTILASSRKTNRDFTAVSEVVFSGWVVD
ncbi:NADase-type glycan-binding domain-containing protein [Actinoplanes sp. NPDC051494]|uniref:NADase-type glycan-binding domain-containing protein n=1 Tax=Actinoplanes sp. NPDC051494 TaxID=3363907 RepID=UPI0037A42C49